MAYRATNLAAKKAADVLLGGGVIAYPTEGVFGLGCLPDEPAAIARILDIKGRDPAKGLILLAATRAQLDRWVNPGDLARLPTPNPEHAVTWIVRPGRDVTPLLRGENPGVAVRLTQHAIAASLCEAAESAIISTSANLSGRSVLRNKIVLRRHLRSLVDYIVPGDCGPAAGPSEIRNLADDSIIRPRST